MERGVSGTGARSERRIIGDFEGIGGDVSKALNATKCFKTAGKRRRDGTRNVGRSPASCFFF